MNARRGEITQLLQEVGGGDKEALAQVIPLVYGELQRAARNYMRKERIGHTLQPTALINEAYLRLAAMHKIQWRNRAHFVAVAAGIMRRILIDHARKHHTAKRGGKRNRNEIQENTLFSEAQARELVEVDVALRRLKELDPLQARIVELRFFGGLSTGRICSRLVTPCRHDLTSSSSEDSLSFHSEQRMGRGPGTG